MVIREYCSVTGRLGSVKIYNSRSEYPFVRKVRMREGGGRPGNRGGTWEPSSQKIFGLPENI